MSICYRLRANIAVELTHRATLLREGPHPKPVPPACEGLAGSLPATRRSP